MIFVQHSKVVKLFSHQTYVLIDDVLRYNISKEKDDTLEIGGEGK